MPGLLDVAHATKVLGAVSLMMTLGAAKPTHEVFK